MYPVYEFQITGICKSIALATSSFHHHVSLCLGGPFVHPHTCSVAFWHTSFIAFHLLSTLLASNTSFLSCYQPSKYISASILSALVCAFSFFFLGAELMTTSTTSNRCCDTHFFSNDFIHPRSHLHNSK